MEEQIVQKTGVQTGNSANILRFITIIILALSILGNGVLGFLMISKPKVKREEQQTKVATVDKEKDEDKLLTLNSWEGVSFQYPVGWQIVSLDHHPADNDWIETEIEEKISINKERNHQWGPHGVSTDIILKDMILKDQSLKAEDYAKKVYENYAENRISLGEVKPMKLNKLTSPTGLSWWKLDGYESIDNSSVTDYFAEYTKTINQVNIGMVETKKHILWLKTESGGEGGSRDTPQSLEMMGQIVKTLKIPEKEKEDKTTNNTLSYEDDKISFRLPQGWRKQKEETIMEEEMIVYSKEDSNSRISFGRTQNKGEDVDPYSVLERYHYKGPESRENPRLEEVYIGGEAGVRSPVETVEAYGNNPEITQNSYYVLSPDKSLIYSFRRTTFASDGASIRIGGWALNELISTVRFKK